MFNVCIAIFLSFYCYDCKGNVFIRYQQTIYKFFHEKGNNFLLLAIFRVWNVTKIIKKEEDQGNHQKRKRQREDHRQDLPRYSYESL